MLAGSADTHSTDPLCSGWHSLALALAFTRPAWADTPLVPLDWLTGYEARAVWRAVAELREAGEDVSLAAVSKRSGLSMRLLERLDDDHFDADVPGLRRRLRGPQVRRTARLLGVALIRGAEDESADLGELVEHVGDLLAALREGMVAA